LTCISYSQFKKINPSAQLILDGYCLDGCSGGNPLSYEFKIFYTYQNLITTSSDSIVWYGIYSNGFSANNSLATGRIKQKNEYFERSLNNN
jgi:hypothetical protein